MAVVTGDKQAEIAREIAADKAVGYPSGYNVQTRRAFTDGWDAAMEYVREQNEQSDNSRNVSHA